MRPKRWIEWSYDDCDRCGDAVEVLTDAVQREGETWVCDGDECRCMTCGLTGNTSCDAETEPSVIWGDWEETE